VTEPNLVRVLQAYEREHKALHRLLLERLAPSTGHEPTLTSWNEAIDAHDAVVEFMEEPDEDGYRA